MAEPSPEPAAEPVSQTPTVEGTLLDYAVSDASRWKGLYYSADPAELQLVMAELDAAGIPYQVYNQNAPHLGPYAGGTVPEIHVRGPDMERAGELVRVLFESPDAVEPAPEPEDGSADMSVDADGNPMPLAVVAEYDTPLEVRDAAAVLASARIAGYCPRMVRRGAQAGPESGSPRRYKLRVAAADLERARAVLDRAEDEAEEEGEERCPHCKSWRIYTVGTFWGNLFRYLARRPATKLTKECLACHRQWKVDASAT